MQFQVPQFIEVEDKIFGQLTLKQFIFLAGGAGLSFIIYRVLGSFILAVLPIIVVMTFSSLLAFYKVNNKPFIFTVEAAFKYFFAPKLYIWKKVQEPAQKKMVPKDEKDAAALASVMVPKISDSKLKDLTWSLDIKESIYNQQNQR